MTRPEFEMTQDERVEHDEMIDSWEYYATEHRFDKVLETVVEVCLRQTLEPLPQIEKTDRTFNQQLVSIAGMHALRAALELHMGIEQQEEYDGDIKEEDIPDGHWLIAIDSPLRVASEHRDSVNLNIIKKAEQLGKALIDEAFDVLGEDAMEYVEMMRSDNAEQQMEAMGWLSDRVRALKPVGEGEIENVSELVDETAEENEDLPPFYHPIKLSPKAIGSYPDINIAPSCLAASVIVSSFFEKAGVSYLHAGVMMSAFQRREEHAAGLFFRVSKGLDNPTGVTYSPIFAEKMYDNAATTLGSLTDDTGYHAAVCVKRADGRWVIVDPYYSVLDTVTQVKDKDFDAVYSTLNELKDDAPGMELSYEGMHHTIETGMWETVLERDLLMEPEALVRAVNVLATEPTTAADTIYTTVILPMFEKMRDSESKTDAHKAVKDLFRFEQEHVEIDNRDIIRQAFNMAFAKYVLWGETAEKVAQRMKHDASYERNRVADIVNLPEAICAAVATINIKENYIGPMSHEKLELGLPHVRIGFSVLSDFASNAGSPLPPSFWYANWPSLVPITETMDREANTLFQKELVEMTAQWTEQKRLTYIKAYGMITKYLSARTSEREAQNGNGISA